MPPHPDQHHLLESYLRQLRLPSFLAQYPHLAADAAQANLSYERFLLALAEAEVHQRTTERIERAITAARFPVRKELSAYDFSLVEGVSKLRVLELAQGGYLSKAEPVLLIGNPGLGKTHIATGLALAACQAGARVRFYNVATLVSDLLQAQQDLRLSRVIAQAQKLHLLVLDEFGFVPFSALGAQVLFQFCSALYERVALLLTTNLRFAEWTSVLGEERLTAAFLDRLTHKAHILEFRGESFRLRQRLQQHDPPGALPAQQKEADAP